MKPHRVVAGAVVSLSVRNAGFALFLLHAGAVEPRVSLERGADGAERPNSRGRDSPHLGFGI